jgi:uncharacterized spore protein YtfJ
MDVQETIAKARDAITVSRVYGEPYERDGVTVIPAASVGGGGGGGGGEGPEGEGKGSGAGFGVGARPVGAYVIENGSVRWVPAPDVTRLALQVLITLSGLALLWLRGRRR